MPLTRIVYISEAAHPFTPKDLHSLAWNAHQNNAIISVTGLLIYSAGNFLQCIEGRLGPLSDLYDRIKRDPRHRKIHRVSYQACETRIFTNWSMGLLNLDERKGLNRERLNKHINLIRRQGISPNSARYCLDIIREFRAQLPQNIVRRSA